MVDINNIVLSNNFIAENQAIGTLIGSFSTTAFPSNDFITYSLVSGSGDSDNALFSIEDNLLLTNRIFDYENHSNYNIRVQATSEQGFLYETELTINISDLTELTEVIAHNTSGFAQGLALSDNYVYVVDEVSGLEIFDISNPSSPNLIGTYQTFGNAYEITVANNYAYIANYDLGLQIIDISNPSSPTLIGTYQTSGNALNVTLVNNLVYITEGNNGLEIIDISDPSSPTLVGNNQAFGLYEVAVANNYAYVANSISGLQIFDLSNSSGPTLIGSYQGDANIYGGVEIAVAGNYAYITDGHLGLKVFDISDSASPTLVGNYDTYGFARGLSIAGNYAYVADDTSGLQVIDISDVTSLTLVATYDTPDSAMDVRVAGNYAYVTDGLSGLQIIDVSHFTNGVSKPDFVNSQPITSPDQAALSFGTAFNSDLSDVGQVDQVLLNASQGSILGNQFYDPTPVFAGEGNSNLAGLTGGANLFPTVSNGEFA